MSAFDLGTITGTLDFDTKGATNASTNLIASLKDVELALGAVSRVATAVSDTINDAIMSGVEAASVQEMAERKLATAIKATGAAIDQNKIEEYASSLQKVTTVGDEATIEAAAFLTMMGATEDALIALLPQVQNMAAVQGDMSTSAKAVGMAMSGNVGALSRYIGAMDPVIAKQIQMADASDRAAMLAVALEEKIGGQARALAETATGAMKQYEGAVGDLNEEFGKMFTSGFADWYGKATDVVVLLTNAMAALSPETKKWIAIITSGAGALAMVAAGVAGIAVLLPSMAAGWAMMAPALMPVIASAGILLVKLTLIIAAIKMMQVAWDSFSGETKDTVVNAFLAIFQAIHQLWDFTTGKLVRGLGAVLEKLGSVTGVSYVEQMGMGLREFEVKYETTMEAMVGSSELAGMEAADAIGDVIKGTLDEIMLSAEAVGKKIKDELGGGVADAAASASKAIAAIKSAAGAGSGDGLGASMVEGLSEGFMREWDNVVETSVDSWEAAWLRASQNVVEVTKKEWDKIWVSGKADAAFGVATGGIEQFAAPAITDFFEGIHGKGTGTGIADAVQSSLVSGNFAGTLGMALGAAAGGPAGAAIGQTVTDILMSGFNAIVDKAIMLFDAIDPRLGGAAAAGVGAAGTAATAALFTPALLVAPIMAVAVPLALLGAGFMSLVKETEGFRQVMVVMGRGVDIIIRQLEPFAGALMAFAGLFFTLMRAVAPLVGAFGSLAGGVLPVLFEVAKGTAVALGTMTTWIMRVNILLTDFGIMLAELTLNEERALELRELKIAQWDRLSDLKDAIADIGDLTFEEAARIAQEEYALSLEDAGSAVDDFTDTLTAGTLNLPAGYKLAGTQADAQGVGGGLDGGVGLTTGDRPPGDTQSGITVYVQGDLHVGDAREFAETVDCSNRLAVASNSAYGPHSQLAWSSKG